MEEEITAINKNDTWEFVELPPNKTPIGLKWIFKRKYNEDGEIKKYKARLVAKGYAQRYEIDYEETFSPVAWVGSIRLLLAVAAQFQYPVYQMDVQSAFLNGIIEEEMYVRQPKGFQIEFKKEKVYILKKALYGLKRRPGLGMLCWIQTSLSK